MTRRLARTALVAAVSAAALVAAGCGEHEPVTEADVEGLYLDVGSLDYQVQISRQLNDEIVPDDVYVSGVPDDVQPPETTETWFGVFLRVQNQTDEPHPTAEEIYVQDTQGNVYRPIDVSRERNPYAYQPTVLAPHTVLPGPDSVQAMSSGQGALVLFKLPLSVYQNRPLELVIEAPAGGHPEEATVDLDL